MIEPSFRAVFVGGLPRFLGEGMVPLGAFYAGWRVAGLATGIAASLVVSLAILAHERRAGRDGLLVRLSVAAVVVQALVGLAADSATVYLAQPVLATLAWALAFLGSAAIGRPLAGALATAWYPFPPELRRSTEFRRVFGVESTVWGVYLLGRSALRVGALLEGGVAALAVVMILTGIPMSVALVAWSVRYAMRLRDT